MNAPSIPTIATQTYTIWSKACAHLTITSICGPSQSVATKGGSTQLYKMSLHVVAFPFTGTNRQILNLFQHDNATSALSEVHSVMVCQCWCGRTRMDCIKPWSEAQRAALGWIGTPPSVHIVYIHIYMAYMITPFSFWIWIIYIFRIHLTNTHRNKRGARPFLCLTKIPSRQDPTSISAPWLSCAVIKAKYVRK